MPGILHRNRVDERIVGLSTTTSLRERFDASVKMMYSPKLSKLVSPGLTKLMVRSWRRGAGSGVVCSARLFFGKNMSVVLPEVVSEAIYTYGFFDRNVTALVMHALEKGQVFLDVGAHFGYFSLLASEIVGDRGKVYAIEPTPSTYRILSENASRADNIEVFNCAAGSSHATAEITDYGIRYCAWNTMSGYNRMPKTLEKAASRKHPVEVVVLDELLRSHSISPDLIKIDTENYEFEVIEGLKETVKNRRPDLILEAGTEGSAKAIEWLVNELGYEMFVNDAHKGVARIAQSVEEVNRAHSNILLRCVR
jgi:FkbM family methyltransferase